MRPEADGNARTLSADDVAELFFCFKSFKHILLGVSGGPDSVAMMVLAREWKKARGPSRPKISVATVDHGLRQGSQDEAQSVGKQARALRLPHAVLQWRGAKPKTGIQDAARDARYALLIAHARKIGADAIAVAHHADDQAETILMRLAAGSGLAGLSGMKAETERDGLVLLRPFLSVPSARLRASLIDRGHAFIDDPSNENSAFARVRWRKARDLLADEGLTRDRLVRLSTRMARADAALAHYAVEAERRHRMPDEVGVLYAPALFEEPFEELCGGQVA